MTDDDRLFFRRNPDRYGRCRLATQAEIDELIQQRRGFELEVGCLVYAFVRRCFEYGCSGSQIIFVSYPPLDWELNEEQCATMFRALDAIIADGIIEKPLQ